MRNSLNRRLQSSARRKSSIPPGRDTVQIILSLALVILGAGVCGASPPIYVSVVMHSEEPPGDPDYVENPPIWLANRAELLYFANMLHNNSIKLNWQSDWNFLKATALYDIGEDTYGLNIARYMHDSLGFEIDPHAHGTVYNKADVAYFIEQLGLMPTNTVGGFIAMPPVSSVLEQFFAPIEADSFPGYFWQAEILWGGSTMLHLNEETLWISGIWKPLDADNFFTHDDSAPLPHVGGYRTNWIGIYDLLDKAESGLLDSTRMYTVTFFVAQEGLSHDGTAAFEEYIHDLEGYTDTGALRWVTLQEAINIWRTEYDSIPNLFWFDTATGIVDDCNRSKLPESFLQTFPNPFNSSVAITVSDGRGLARQTLTKIEIYDLRGNVVWERSPDRDNRHREMSPTNRTFIWTPAQSIASGLYLVRAYFNGQTIVKRIIYLK